MLSQRKLSGDPPETLRGGSPDILAKRTGKSRQNFQKKFFFAFFFDNFVWICQWFSQKIRRPPAEGLRGVSGWFPPGQHCWFTRYSYHLPSWSHLPNFVFMIGPVNLHYQHCYLLLNWILNYGCKWFSFSILGTIIISSEDPMDATFAEKTLKDLGVADGSILSCDDFLQDYDVKVIVYHR